LKHEDIGMRARVNDIQRARSRSIFSSTLFLLWSVGGTDFEKILGLYYGNIFHGPVGALIQDVPFDRVMSAAGLLNHIVPSLLLLVVASCAWRLWRVRQAESEFSQHEGSHPASTDSRVMWFHYVIAGLAVIVWGVQAWMGVRIADVLFPPRRFGFLYLTGAWCSTVLGVWLGRWFAGDPEWDEQFWVRSSLLLLVGSFTLHIATSFAVTLSPSVSTLSSAAVPYGLGMVFVFSGAWMATVRRRLIRKRVDDMMHKSSSAHDPAE